MPNAGKVRKLKMSISMKNLEPTKPKSILKSHITKTQNKPIFFSGNELEATNNDQTGYLNNFLDFDLHVVPYYLINKQNSTAHKIKNDDRFKRSAVTSQMKSSEVSRHKRRQVYKMYILHSAEINKKIIQILLKSLDSCLEELKQKIFCEYFTDSDLFLLHKDRLVSHLKRFLESHKTESYFNELNGPLGLSNNIQEIGIALSAPNMLDIEKLENINRKEQINHARSTATISKNYLNTPAVYGSLPSTSFLDSFGNKDNKDLEFNPSFVSSKELNISEEKAIPKNTLVSTAHTDKKMVRFADSFGFDLEKVKIITNNSFSEMFSLQDDSIEEETQQIDHQTSSKPFLVLMPLFSLRKQDKTSNIILDEYVYDYENKIVRCMVKVKNISFSKKVYGRITFDSWKSSFDLNAGYVRNDTMDIENSSEFSYLNKSKHDYFGFCIIIPEKSNNAVKPTSKSDSTVRIEFALCYQLSDNESYWDNNLGQNYKFQCFYNK